GEHQVADQAHQAEQRGARTQQVGQVRAQDVDPPFPRGRRHRRRRPRACAGSERRQEAGQGGVGRCDPQEPGRQQEVGHRQAGRLPL
ncbi:MAG: SSU ribosomal protein S20p, partial [uncultured Nocardioidaceae bacterium]